MPKKIVKFEKGQILVKEKSSSRKLYIIRRGKVRVYKEYFGQKVTLAVLESGQVFGELSFFDAEPRSASVEAITDVEAIIVDGGDEKQIKDIPKWVLSVLNNTFRRFREMDEEITLLKRMNDFQKKTQKIDNVAKTLYLEILRANKTLSMLASESQLKNNTEYFNWYLISQDMNNVMGKKYIKLDKYLKELINNEIISHSDEDEDDENLFSIDIETMDAFNKYITEGIEKQTYLLLSHSALSLMRTILDQTQVNQEAKDNGEDDAILNDDMFKLKNIPLFDDSIKELENFKVLKMRGNILHYKPEVLKRHFIYQSILKNFDHSTLYSEEE